MVPLQFWLSIFLGIHRNPPKKEFSNSCKVFLMTALTGHGHPGQFKKKCQNGTFWPLHDICIFFVPNALIWSALKVLFFCIQNLSQALSKCISKWIDGIFFKNPSLEIKNYFCFGSLWMPRKPGRQNQGGPIFFGGSTW